jgi:hypothetical protein
MDCKHQDAKSFCPDCGKQIIATLDDVKLASYLDSKLISIHSVHQQFDASIVFTLVRWWKTDEPALDIGLFHHILHANSIPALTHVAGNSIRSVLHDYVVSGIISPIDSCDSKLKRLEVNDKTAKYIRVSDIKDCIPEFLRMIGEVYIDREHTNKIYTKTELDIKLKNAKRWFRLDYNTKKIQCGPVIVWVLSKPICVLLRISNHHEIMMKELEGLESISDLPTYAQLAYY